MTFTAALNRVRMDFVAMPELELSLPQAVRMWRLGMDDCRNVLDSLVDTGFLSWTAKRTVVRSRRIPAASIQQQSSSYNPVDLAIGPDMFVEA